MTPSARLPVIRLRGVRHNNLKNFDLDLPLGQLMVITGLSGSGKSSLAFDTLYAEGQRRYIETFSPYARQFFDRMDKPQVDRIDGIPPAIAIEQRNTVRTTRSTVGTMTELCDYLKLLWPHLARLHCRQCHQPVRRESPQTIWETVRATLPADSEVIITFAVPLTEKLSLADSLQLVSRQGYQRLLVGDRILRVDDAPAKLPPPGDCLTVVQDRLPLKPARRARFIEACEQAYHFGKGKLRVHQLVGGPNGQAKTASRALPFSAHLHCAPCDLDYRDPVPALFSFNHPMGACPQCKGFGRIITIDYHLALPDRSLTLAQGAIKPWRGGFSAECQADLEKFCRARDIALDVPFDQLPESEQQWVINGDDDYGTDDAHQWPHAWYGLKGYFRWLESKAYKMHVRVLLSRYRAYSTCPECQGRRLQPEALLYQVQIQAHPSAAAAPNHSASGRRPSSAIPHRLAALSLADFYALPIDRALEVVDQLAAQRPLPARDPLAVVLEEVRSRLGYLVEVGLGYLTLDRPTRTLSGGETERVNLTTCLGTSLVHTLFVLDEPSVGLHPRDTDRLVRILQRLRDAGNTVVVVEHEARVIRAADQIVDLGPGSGAAGGQVVFQGPVTRLLRHPRSLTGQYLSGRKRIELPARRAVSLEPAHDSAVPGRRKRAGALRPSASPGPAIPTLPTAASGAALREAIMPYRTRSATVPPALRLEHARRHNLKDLTVEIPLRRFVCLTGVSGSGKTTLVRDVLLPALEARLGASASQRKASDRLAEDEPAAGDNPSAPPEPASGLRGQEQLERVVLVDQSPIGKSPRSTPAVYTGAFDHIRELFARTDLARQRGLNASAFSFNSAQGQCDRCRGVGFEKVEMQFLSDVFIRCPECNGRRYREHILEVKVESGGELTVAGARRKSPKGTRRPPTAPPTSATPPTSSWSIADVLEATVDEGRAFFSRLPDSPPARRTLSALNLLHDVGLGYLRLGQPINTLSGGESQRLKLAGHLAAAGSGARSVAEDGASADRPALFLFDEPTTGLHFDDVRVLLAVFQRLVDAGHSLLVIEHNLEVIKCADWIIDLGPEAGDRGGRLVAQGPPEVIARCKASYTGQALQAVLPGSTQRRPAKKCRLAKP